MPRDLLRLVRTPQGHVMLDRWGRLPGRGAYVCVDLACFRKALKPAKLASALKGPVEMPTFETLHQSAMALFYGRLAASLSMAHKAGAVISGYMPLRRACSDATIVCMVLATDIAAARAEEYHRWCTQRHVPCLTCLTKAKLGSLIGKSPRSALGLTDPRFRDLCMSAFASLMKLCCGDPWASTTVRRSPSSS